MKDGALGSASCWLDGGRSELDYDVKWNMHRWIVHNEINNMHLENRLGEFNFMPGVNGAHTSVRSTWLSE